MGKKKKKNKVVGYTRVGDVLGVDTTILQAAALLDEASLNAIAAKDTEAISELAKHWMELGAMMHVVLGGAEEDGEKDDEEDDHKGSSILGFGPTDAREKAEAIALAKKSRG